MTDKKIIEAEERFRQATIEYLWAIGSLDENNVLVHRILLCSTAQLDDPNTAGVIYDAETGFPFWAQGGLLDYALTRHHAYVQQDFK